MVNNITENQYIHATTIIRKSLDENHKVVIPWPKNITIQASKNIYNTLVSIAPLNKSQEDAMNIIQQQAAYNAQNIITYKHWKEALLFIKSRDIGKIAKRHSPLTSDIAIQTIDRFIHDHCTSEIYDLFKQTYTNPLTDSISIQQLKVDLITNHSKGNVIQTIVSDLEDIYDI